MLVGQKDIHTFIEGLNYENCKAAITQARAPRTVARDSQAAGRLPAPV